jgi:hypothetical protein
MIAVYQFRNWSQDKQQLGSGRALARSAAPRGSDVKKKENESFQEPHAVTATSRNVGVAAR